MIQFLKRFYCQEKYLSAILSIYKINPLKNNNDSLKSKPGYLHIAKTIELVKEYNLNENNLIVDIGAADGYVSSLFAQEFPSTPIISFEPIKESYKKLCEVAKNYKSINPVNKALGIERNRMSINVANRITASSLFKLNPQEDDNFITQNISLVRKEEIVISTLDHEIENDKGINIIKLDVQGSELNVLKGSVNVLKNTYFIVIEVCNHDYYENGAKYYQVDAFLRQKNFELVTFLPSLQDKKKTLEWDCIYRNKNVND